MCKEYTVYEAAEMTARCKAVDFYWNAPPGERFVALLWCNETGEYIAGLGSTAWDAVLDAHKKKRSRVDCASCSCYNKHC